MEIVISELINWRTMVQMQNQPRILLDKLNAHGGIDLVRMKNELLIRSQIFTDFFFFTFISPLWSNKQTYDLWQNVLKTVKFKDIFSLPCLVRAFSVKTTSLKGIAWGIYNWKRCPHSLSICPNHFDLTSMPFVLMNAPHCCTNYHSHAGSYKWHSHVNMLTLGIH